MKLLLDVSCGGQDAIRIPIWFMRQAGRYLPEYRVIKSRCQDVGFFGMCYNPDIASEITMQPVYRFDIDAAIIFSDILVVPEALGWPVEFVPNFGPKLEVFASDMDLKRLHLTNAIGKFTLVGESIAKVKSVLPDHVALIGFAGSPFTVAAYMLNGGRIDDGSALRAKLLQGCDITSLLEVLTESTIRYLEIQIEAGAEMLQLFESHALHASNEQWFERYVMRPNIYIARSLKAKYPHIPLTFFPRYAGIRYNSVVNDMMHDDSFNVLGIDETVEDRWVKEQQAKDVIIQGNLDNHLLCYGSEMAIMSRIDTILSEFSRPFIFNLGHGILKESNPAMVEKVVSYIRSRESSRHAPQIA